MKSTLLKPLYKKAVSGLPVLGTPEDVAANGASFTGRYLKPLVARPRRRRA